MKGPNYRDMETSTDDDLLLTTDSDGNQVYVKLRHPRSRGSLENKIVSTENESICIGGEDNPFQGKNCNCFRRLSCLPLLVIFLNNFPVLILNT